MKNKKIKTIWFSKTKILSSSLPLCILEVWMLLWLIDVFTETFQGITMFFWSKDSFNKLKNSYLCIPKAGD